MANLIIFPSLVHATKAGFALFDRTAAGYLVRAKTRTGWTVAFVPVNPIPATGQDNA